MLLIVAVATCLTACHSEDHAHKDLLNLLKRRNEIQSQLTCTQLSRTIRLYNACFTDKVILNQEDLTTYRLNHQADSNLISALTLEEKQLTAQIKNLAQRISPKEIEILQKDPRWPKMDSCMNQDFKLLHALNMDIYWYLCPMKKNSFCF